MAKSFELGFGLRWKSFGGGERDPQATPIEVHPAGRHTSRGGDAQNCTGVGVSPQRERPRPLEVEEQEGEGWRSPVTSSSPALPPFDPALTWAWL